MSHLIQSVHDAERGLLERAPHARRRGGRPTLRAGHIVSGEQRQVLAERGAVHGPRALLKHARDALGRDQQRVVRDERGGRWRHGR